MGRGVILPAIDGEETWGLPYRRRTISLWTATGREREEGEKNKAECAVCCCKKSASRGEIQSDSAREGPKYNFDDSEPKRELKIVLY
jgi:hypothetical protein